MPPTGPRYVGRWESFLLGRDADEQQYGWGVMVARFTNVHTWILTKNQVK